MKLNAELPVAVSKVRFEIANTGPAIIAARAIPAPSATNHRLASPRPRRWFPTDDVTCTATGTVMASSRPWSKNSKPTWGAQRRQAFSSPYPVVRKNPRELAHPIFEAMDGVVACPLSHDHAKGYQHL